MEENFGRPTTFDDFVQDHKGRRQGLLRALTTERRTLHTLCNPEGRELCLYGYPDGSWRVSTPSDEIPADLPEPCCGINYTRDSVSFEEWLAFVARHSDAWLYGITFFYTINLSKQKRADLFDVINGLPTVFEVVTGATAAKQIGSARSVATASKLDTKRRAPIPKEEYEECGGNVDEYDDDGEEEEEEEEAYCGACQGKYSSSSSQMWILCDGCNKWYHGKCVKVTAAKTRQIDEYTCPFCIQKRSHQ